MPYIGQSISWTPCAYCNMDGSANPRSTRGKEKVHGKIVRIYEAHRYFLVEADIFGRKLRECFKI